MTKNSKEALKKRADARFKQEERALDGRKAMTEYEAQVLAIREKTAHLRALRLAKEAQAQNEEPRAENKSSAAQRTAARDNSSLNFEARQTAYARTQPRHSRARGFSYDDREEILLRPYRPSSLRFSSNSALSISPLAKRSSRMSRAARPRPWPPQQGHPPWPWWKPWP